MGILRGPGEVEFLSLQELVEPHSDEEDHRSKKRDSKSVEEPQPVLAKRGYSKKRERLEKFGIFLGT
jgi:hypothetical protein